MKSGTLTLSEILKAEGKWSGLYYVDVFGEEFPS